MIDFLGDLAHRRGIHEDTMTALRLPKHSSQPPVSHRSYRDTNPTEVVLCRRINTDSELISLAAGIDRIELRQAPGRNPAPPILIEGVIRPLRAIDLVGGSADPRAERMERELRRQLCDALARIRVRCNRRLLAGVTDLLNTEGDQRVLLLVFAGNTVDSCEWHLEIAA